jgi:cerevisin
VALSEADSSNSGVNIKHVELEGRAEWGKTIPLNDQDIDANGHGSHVAVSLVADCSMDCRRIWGLQGTIASRKYGVAKKAHIVAVKVLGSNGSGSMSDGASPRTSRESA